ncbi:MAG: hypothetical protein HOV80_24430 [Polyangiaceae bacterium]|nr:hypothetical protein [Polyangiaceae bacterium]
MKSHLGLGALAVAMAAGIGCQEPTEEESVGVSVDELANDKMYEVWLVDQSNNNGTTWGGKIYIWEGKDLEKSNPKTSDAETIDLGGATTALCMAQTGANPVRPHMLFTNGAQTHMILSFVVSGHVVIYDAKTRAPISCIRTTVGFGGQRQVHAAIPAPDDSYILVANQNGKLLERIDADYDTNTFTLNPAAMINLATCTTPNGAPCELAGLRNDNAPICPIIDFSSTYGFITLRGGGLFVVDGKQTPMQIVGEYDINNIRPNGCVGQQLGNKMYISSGGGAANNLSSMDLYRLPATGYTVLNPPNVPAREVVFHVDDTVFDVDGHGATLTEGGKYIWFNDRTNGEIQVIKTNNNQHMGTIELNGALASDAAPDLSKLSPNGDFMFVSLRGPIPLSGDPHASTGDKPGLGILKTKSDGKKGEFKHLLRITNVDSTNVERADGHAIELRRTKVDHCDHD